MFKKILGNDLKRKKTMNFIILIFIVLATTFISGAVQNISVVISGIDYYLEQANVRDFMMIAVGSTEENDRAIEKFLQEEDNVTDYRVEDALLAERMEDENRNRLEFSNICLINQVDTSPQNFFDKENKKIETISKGEVYLSRALLEEFSLEVGDTMYLKYDTDAYLKVKVGGYAKDALLGSDLMGAKRILVGEEDYKTLKQGNLTDCGMYHVDSKNVKTFQQDYGKQTFCVSFGCDKATVKVTYLLDIVIALVVLVVSIGLVCITMIMLRFTISFTVKEEYEQIGVMKAIGIPEPGIRSLYIVKYIAIAVTGAIIGCICSVPFGEKMLDSVTQNIFVENSGTNVAMNVFVSILVVGIVIGFAYLSTRTVKKMNPMAALRDGMEGESFAKTGKIGLTKGKLSVTTSMALNDIISECRRYVILFITSLIGIWLLLMVVNTVTTLQSDKTAVWFGMCQADFVLVDDTTGLVTASWETIEDAEKYLEQVKVDFENQNINVKDLRLELNANVKLEKGKDAYKVLSLQSVGASAEAYQYEEGTAPIEENEVAMATGIADKMNVSLGDKIKITTGEKESEYIVTATYQSMNNMGEVIRFSQKAKVEYDNNGGNLGMEITMADTLSDVEKEHIRRKIEKLYPGAIVYTMGEYIELMLGGTVSQVGELKGLLFFIVIVINVLVVILLQKMFLLREKREIATMKAIGFSDSALIVWQIKRIGIVVFAGILVGVLTGEWFTQLTCGQVFKYMGARIDFQLDILQGYILYPVVMFAVILVACTLVTQKIRKIDVQTMNKE